ncbi:hypothetical protein FS842_010631 [Serendipita sp. 407]|nr:hypothetical protein FS842_010631 [Serendipita sp. 407]
MLKREEHGFATREPGVLMKASEGDSGHFEPQFSQLYPFGIDKDALQLSLSGFPYVPPDPTLVFFTPSAEHGFGPTMDCSSFDTNQFLNLEEINQHPSTYDEGHVADAFAPDSPLPSSPPDTLSVLSPQPSCPPSVDSSPTPPPATPSPMPPLETQSPEWDYNNLIENVMHCEELPMVLHEIFVTIADGNRPSKEQARKFVVPRRGRHYCAVQNCKWHTIGWRREDRGVTHFLKEHLRLLAYPCPDCDQVYKWPHDLTSHQRRHHLNVPQQEFVCEDCGNGFPKSFNLARHKRNVHRSSKKPRAMRGAC